MYISTTVIVAGAIEQDTDYFDYALFDEVLRAWEEEAESSGYRVEIYTCEHEHPYNPECECIQYKQDHHPYRVFNENGNT